MTFLAVTVAASRCALACALLAAGFAAQAQPAQQQPPADASAANLPHASYSMKVPLMQGDSLVRPAQVAVVDPRAPQVKTVSLEQVRQLFIGLDADQLKAALGEPAARGPRGLWQYVVAADQQRRFIVSMWLNDSGRLWMANTSQPPLPALVSALAPVPPVAEKPPVVAKAMKLRASELFAFGSSTLRPQVPQIDDIATQLIARPEISKVVVAGYTDRLGSEAQNQQLSERRAQAVRIYLHRKGVAGERLEAVGMGSANPLVNCDGKLKRAQLIQCLEPNRRVELVANSAAL